MVTNLLFGHTTGSALIQRLPVVCNHCINTVSVRIQEPLPRHRYIDAAYLQPALSQRALIYRHTAPNLAMETTARPPVHGQPGMGNDAIQATTVDFLRVLLRAQILLSTLNCVSRPVCPYLLRRPLTVSITTNLCFPNRSVGRGVVCRALSHPYRDRHDYIGHGCYTFVAVHNRTTHVCR